MWVVTVVLYCLCLIMMSFTNPGTVAESPLFHRENFLSSRLAHTREQRTIAN